MHKLERPAAVNNLELAIQLGAKTNQATHDLLTYILGLEALAMQQGAAVSYLQAAIRDGGAASIAERCSIIETSTLLASGQEERARRAQ
ncbi:MAG: hypothetical protein ACK5JO_11600 [Halodesulfovibrio sp.]